MTNVNMATSTIRVSLFDNAHRFAFLCLLFFARLGSVARSISEIFSNLDGCEDSVADIANKILNSVSGCFPSETLLVLYTKVHARE